MSLETLASFRRGRVLFRKIIILDALKKLNRWNLGSSILSIREDLREKNEWFLPGGDIYVTLYLLPAKRRLKLALA